MRKRASVAIAADAAGGKAGEERGLLDGVVRLVGRVERPGEEVLGEAVAARGDERREVGERAARGEHAPRRRRQAGDAAEPADDVLLELREARRGREDADVAVDGVGDQVGDGGVGEAAARDVGEVAGARGVEALRDDALEEQDRGALPPRRPSRAAPRRGSARRLGRRRPRPRRAARGRLSMCATIRSVAASISRRSGSPESSSDRSSPLIVRGRSRASSRERDPAGIHGGSGISNRRDRASTCDSYIARSSSRRRCVASSCCSAMPGFPQRPAAAARSARARAAAGAAAAASRLST